MMTVKQLAQKCGVSVRTLHHYDAIGLLKPTNVTEAGYRLYDDAGGEGTGRFAREAIACYCKEQAGYAAL